MDDLKDIEIRDELDGISLKIDAILKKIESVAPADADTPDPSSDAQEAQEACDTDDDLNAAGTESSKL